MMTPNQVQSLDAADDVVLAQSVVGALSALDSERANHLRELASLLRARDGANSGQASNIEGLAAAATPTPQ